jgi:hypothetical protein
MEKIYKYETVNGDVYFDNYFVVRDFCKSNKLDARKIKLGPDADRGLYKPPQEPVTTDGQS